MPVTEWKPISRPQEVFLSLPDTIREGFFGGSAGPGKSECLMMYPIVREYFKHSRFKALFMRRTYPELKAEIIPRSRELYTAFGGKFNKGDLVWEFPDYGSLIFFGHCEHESDVHKYDSMEINLFLPDELESFTEYIYLYIGFTRVRTSVPELPAIIRAAGMPGGIGHSWVKNRFIKPNPRGSEIIKGKGGNKRIFVFSTLADNKRIDPSYANALEALPEAEKRAKKYGDWNSYEGQVFEEFRDKHYPDEPENALHVIEPFDIPDWWPRVTVIDWGYKALTYALYGAISPNKRVYIYREQAWRGTKVAEWGPYVKECLDRENVKLVRVCKSAGQERGQEHTIQQQIEEELGRTVELAGGAPGTRVAGKLLLHEYFRWQPKYLPKKEVIYSEEHALWLLRNKTDREYKQYIESLKQPEPEKNLPKLQILRTSPEGKEIVLLPEAIKSCIYDKTAVEDVAEFEGDDPYDTVRYLVDAVDRYFAESEAEFQKLEAQDLIAKEFEVTQDWNRLFRRAIAIEKSNTYNIGPVRRYHHR